MLHGELLPADLGTGVPFLFELAVRAGECSITVRQYNDFWLLNRVTWGGKLPSRPGSGPDFLVYREYTKTQEGLLFYTQYLPVKNRAGFEVLTPAWSMFIGFSRED